MVLEPAGIGYGLMEDGAPGGGDLGVGFVDRGAGRESAHHAQPPGMVGGFDQAELAVQHFFISEGDVDLRAVEGIGAEEAARHDADDGESDVVDDHAAAEDGGGAMEAVVPKRLADDHGEAGGLPPLRSSCGLSVRPRSGGVSSALKNVPLT